MWIGWIQFDVMLADVHSLKEKRAIIKPVLNELRRKFTVVASETKHMDLHRRSEISVAVISGDASHVIEVLDSVDTFMVHRAELETLSARRRLINSEDIS